MKKLTFFILFIGLFLVSARKTFAAIIVIDPEGEVVQNVLSEDTSYLDIPKHSSIEVKQIADANPANVSMVSLEKKADNQISLVVSTDDGKKELDVSKVKDQLIEIEERPSVQKLTLGVRDGFFTLMQNNVSVETEYPISVDPKTAEIMVTTPSGKKYISILPYEAVETTLRTKLINKIDIGTKIKILDKDTQLQYQISGQREFNFFNVYSYTVPVVIDLSASTGEILSLDAPLWYKLVGNLIS